MKVSAIVNILQSVVNNYGDLEVGEYSDCGDVCTPTTPHEFFNPTVDPINNTCLVVIHHMVKTGNEFRPSNVNNKKAQKVLVFNTL